MDRIFGFPLFSRLKGSPLLPRFSQPARSKARMTRSGFSPTEKSLPDFPPVRALGHHGEVTPDRIIPPREGLLDCLPLRETTRKVGALRPIPPLFKIGIKKSGEFPCSHPDGEGFLSFDLPYFPMQIHQQLADRNGENKLSLLQCVEHFLPIRCEDEDRLPVGQEIEGGKGPRRPLHVPPEGRDALADLLEADPFLLQERDDAELDQVAEIVESSRPSPGVHGMSPLCAAL